MTQRSFWERVGVLVREHSENYGVVPSSIVRSTLSQRAFVLEANVFEHRTSRRVVFGDIYPRSVQVQVLKNVFEHGDHRRSAIPVVPKRLFADQHRDLSVTQRLVDRKLSFTNMFARQRVDGEDRTVRLVVRIMEYLIPFNLGGTDHVLRLVTEVGRVSVGVTAKPSV